MARQAGVVHVIAPSCMACGDCRNICPQAGAIIPGEIYSIDPEVCLKCGLCVDGCMTSSIYARQSAAAL